MVARKLPSVYCLEGIHVHYFLKLPAPDIKAVVASPREGRSLQSCTIANKVAPRAEKRTRMLWKETFEHWSELN
jgi:hypothetical protein